eukprot:jgi/Botrbrau1/11594/Bobra.247_1s0014.1
MTVYECMCGFSTPSATTFTRHLSRFRESTEHYMVPITEPKPHSAAKQTEEASRHQEDSHHAGTEVAPGAEFCTSPKQNTSIRRVNADARHLDARELPCDSTVMPARATSLQSGLKEGSFVSLRALDSPLSSEAVDAAWEAVTNVVSEDEDEYAQLTRRFEAIGATTPEPSGDWGLAGVLSRTVERLRTSWIGSTPSHDRSRRLSVENMLNAVDFATADTIDSILLWNDPWLSTKVCAGGFYALYCLRQLLHGVFFLQPTTVMAGVPFSVLLYHLCLRVLAANIHILPDGYQAWACKWLPGLSVTLLPDKEAFEKACKRLVIQILTTATRIVAPWIGATAACFARHLRGDPVGASAWLALTLWGIMCFGELRFIDQSAMLILLWGMLFSLPPLYVASKRALDALIDELLRFVISVANGGERNTLILSGGTFLTMALLLEGSFLLRFSLAGVSGIAVLIWRACQVSSGADILEHAQ